MKILGVIPARYASTRLPGKVLLPIAGKPMIQHVWERTKKSKLLSDVWIAADDQQIMEAAEKFGAKAVLTSVHHQSGTDRIAEAVKNVKVDMVVNIQGDEPLMDVRVIDALVKALLKNKSYQMATVVKRIDRSDDIHNPNIVKVVVDANQDALYFSRSEIPFNRDRDNGVDYFKHIGIYAYRKNFLLRLTKMPPSRLEKIEKLEQLRVLEAGYKIKMILTDVETAGVDTAEDLKKVEKLLSRKI